MYFNQIDEKRRTAIYVRISTAMQKTDRQVEELVAFAKSNRLNFDESTDIYKDIISGFKDGEDRPNFSILIAKLEMGEYTQVLFSEFSRLDRKPSNLLKSIEYYQSKNVWLWFGKQQMWVRDKSDISTQIMISVLAVMSQYEIELLTARGWMGEFKPYEFDNEPRIAMTIEDIKKIIATDETRTLELKKSTGELKEGMHSACAFLNTDGGWLFFGIAPTSLKILGQQVTDNTRKEIAQAIKGLEPAIDVPVGYIEVPDRPGNYVIAMHFDGWVWGMKPSTFHGCPYIRIESTTSVMPPEIYEERLRECRPMEYAWENLTTLGATLDDIDENRVMGIVRAGIREGRMPETALEETSASLLNRWGLVANGKPTIGA